MKKIVITQSNYIPWKGYFDLINSSNIFVIYDDMQYTRRDWRNRNKIKTVNGLQWLTIPVEAKGKYFQKINETVIADDKWGIKHWKTLSYNYSKATNFRVITDYFSDLFLENSYSLITDVNYAFIKRINEYLGIKTQIMRSDDFGLLEGKSEKLLGICIELEATHYISSLAAKEYLDVELFTKSGIIVEWINYSDYPEYEQLYPPFDHYVSIMDLLFSEGKDSIKYMKSFK